MKISITQLRKIIAEETTKLARLNEAPRRTQPALVLPPISSTWLTTSNLTSPEEQLIYADATSQINESDWENLFEFLLRLKSTGKRPQDPTKNYNGRPLSGSAHTPHPLTLHTIPPSGLRHVDTYVTTGHRRVRFFGGQKITQLRAVGLAGRKGLGTSCCHLSG